MTSIRSIGISLLLLLLLAGCASPARRIEKNQELFDSFPVATQARIRGGKIDLGFTEDMVRIALGDPQRMLVRRTATDTRDIWLYLDTIQQYERQHADIDGLSLYGPNGGGAVGGTAWFNVLQEKEILKMRTEFKDGRVVAIEEPVKGKPKP
jgi:hypothetical protein